MAGNRVSAIRKCIAVAMHGVGFAYSAYTFSQIGKDAGSKRHRSFATASPIRSMRGRQHIDVQQDSSIQIRALVELPIEDPHGYAADDAAEDICQAVLFDFDESGVMLEIGRIDVVPHAQHARILVITVTVTASHQLYTPEAIA